MATEKIHIPGFLTKTFEIFSNPEYSDSCGWGANGETIVIRKIEQFSKQVLPNYFKHSNFQSFVRQLNMYDFRKTVQDPNHGEFLHPNFKKGRQDLLKLIKRKASSKHLVDHSNQDAGSTAKKTKGAKSQPVVQSAEAANIYNDNYNDVLQSNLLRLDSNTSVTSWTSLDFPSSGFLESSQSKSASQPPVYPLGNTELVRMSSIGSYGAPPLISHVSNNDKELMVSESGALLAELHEQRVSREQFEKTIENRLNQLEDENSLLKTLFVESHQKNIMMQERMDKLMKSIYNLFMGGPGVNQQQLLNDITNSVSSYGSNTNKLMIEDSAGSSREIIRNLNSVGEVSNFDITNLRRLPSLDLSGLSQPSADLYNNLVNASQEGGTLVRMTSKDGMELSRQGNSFEYAASFVTPPNLMASESLQPKQNNGSSGGTYPMSDRVTFLSEHSNPREDKDSEDLASKRRKLDSSLGPSEPLDSEVTAAHTFIENLNKNQEVTMQRLDSLEITLSSLLEGSMGESSSGSIEKNDSG